MNRTLNLVQKRCLTRMIRLSPIHFISKSLMIRKMEKINESVERFNSVSDQWFSICWSRVLSQSTSCPLAVSCSPRNWSLCFLLTSSNNISREDFFIWSLFFVHISIPFVSKHKIVSANTWRVSANVISNTSSKNWLQIDSKLINATFSVTPFTCFLFIFLRWARLSALIMQQKWSRSCSWTISSVKNIESSKENADESSSYKISCIPRAKTNKTVNVIEQLDRLTKSDNKTSHLHQSVRRQLSSHNDPRKISKFEVCCQHAPTDRIDNAYLLMETLLRLVYHLLTKTETQSKQLTGDEEVNSIAGEWPD